MMKVRLKTLYKPNRYRFRLMLERVDLSEVIFFALYQGKLLNESWLDVIYSIYLLFHFTEITSLEFYSFIIPMSHWRCRATEGTEFWISCTKRPAFLSNSCRLHLIQNSAPSVARRRQCDIRIGYSFLIRFEVKVAVWDFSWMFQKLPTNFNM